MRGIEIGGDTSRRTGTTWTAERLRDCVEECCGGQPLVVLANREPLRHECGRDGEPVAIRSASGLVTALEPMLAACRGVWIAHGAGAADRQTVTSCDGLDVPSGRSTYRLRRVWLTEREQRRYYGGFANEGLWPLCHRVGVAPIFRAEDFAAYASVNETFATAVVDEVDSDSPVVMVEDYHFALAPRMIRELLPDSTVIAFWHIPWPAAGEFEQCPRWRDLLRGLLASNVVGFHTDADCRAFLDAAARLDGTRVDRRRGAVSLDGQHTTVGAFPIGIEWPNRAARQAPPVDVCRTSVAARLDLPLATRLIVGVDRLDYTKGLCEKALAFERLLETSPEFRRTVTFVQIAEPSRESLPAYRDLRARLVSTVDRINRRFGDGDYRPIVLIQAHHDPAQVYEYLRAADVCYVGSLHDGMNLVAKEFAAARDDERGVLVLSSRTGAARQLQTALLVDPCAIDAAAAVLARALRMTDGEQSRRMRALRAVVAEFNSFWWAARMLQDATVVADHRRGNRSGLFVNSASMPRS